MSRYFSTLQRGHPPSPPDTEVAIEPSMLSDPRQRAEADVASPYSRRAPSIFYKQNEAAPSRETARGRPPRWLVIVLPPPVLDLDSAGGESSRRTSAVLLPLFPTMYAQLAAIAREFNLPSTTGIRVYLHLPENSIDSAGLITPRITDDVWPLLWTQYFQPDDRSALPPTIPVSGKIEFDLDLQQARWYNAWARSHGQIPGQILSLPGRAIYEDDDSVVQASDNSGQRSRPTHMRQLSLLERRSSARSVPFPLMTTAQQPAGRGTSGDTAGMTETTDVQANARNQRDDVESLVHKWRANTPTINPGITHISPEPSPCSLNLDDYSWSISSAGPLTYDPLSSPTGSDSSRVRSVHLADRAAGSVVLTPATATSWGPPRSGFSREGSLISNASRYPSPDIAARAMSEVPLTPNTATSWGPPDDDFNYDLLLMADDESRYPTPNIAYRMMDNIPVTPSTATSWGLQADHFSRVNLFTELGAEHTSDREQLSRTSVERAAVVHQQLTVFSHVWPYIERAARSKQHVMFPHVWPYTDPPTSRLSAPYPDPNMPYPNSKAYSHQSTLPDVPTLAPMDTKLTRHYPSLEVYPAVYPFNLDCLYLSVYVNTPAPLDESEALVDELSSQVYPFGWDYSRKSLDGKTPERFDMDLSSQVYPFDWDYSHQPRRAQSFACSPSHPTKTLPPSLGGVEPSSLVYPLTWDFAQQAQVTRRQKLNTPSLAPSVAESYDGVDSSSLVYPFGWDYLHHKLHRVWSDPEAVTPEPSPSSVVYPFSWDYKHKSSKAIPEMDTSQVYPFTWDYDHRPPNAKVAPSLAPFISDSFEGVDSTSLVYPYGWDYIHHEVRAARSTHINQPAAGKDLSPQVYPFRWDYIPKSKRDPRNVESIDWSSLMYPFSWDYTHKSSKQALIAGPSLLLPISIDGQDTASLAYPFSWNYVQPLRTTLEHVYTPLVYDGVDAASLVYPFSWNYDHHVKRGRSSRAPVTTVLSCRYPNLVVYAPTYPHNLDNIYPPLNRGERSLNPRANSTLELDYPNLVIYKPVYPHNLEQIYLPISAAALVVALPDQTRLPINIPKIIPQYINPEAVGRAQRAITDKNLPGNRHIRSRTAFVNKSLDVEYPNTEIYRPVYPHNLDCIYPRAASYSQISNEVKKCQDARHIIVKLPSAYPFLQIYDHVYPSLEVYPSAHSDMEMMVELPSSRQSVFHPVPSYPYLPSPFLRAARPERFPRSVQEDEQYQEVDAEAPIYREELLPSSISFYSDAFDLELDGAAQQSRRSTASVLGGVIDGDERLGELDSPTRRFYLARQQDLRNSGEFADDDEEVDPFEFDEVPLPPITFSGRPSLSLEVLPEASTFFDDDDEEDFSTDDDLYQAYQDSRPGRFPKPNLSAVTEETAPLSGLSAWSNTRFPSPVAYRLPSGPAPRSARPPTPPFKVSR